MGYKSHFCVDGDGPARPESLPFDAVCLGRGVFETILFVGGRPVLWDRHVARLAGSCEALSIAAADGARRIAGHCLKALQDARLAKARVRIALFGSADDAPAAVVSVGDCAAAPESMSLMVSPIRRDVSAILARHKTVDYLPNLAAREAARSADFDDALVVDSAGNVAETTTANIFFLSEGRMLTPSTTCALPGIVRSWVLETARRLKLDCRERDVSLEELCRCEAAFVTNSIVGLVPVSGIAGRALAQASSLGPYRTLSAGYGSMLEKTARGA